MIPANKLIKSISNWAKDQEDIRALVLIGSRTRKGKPDRLTRIGLTLFTPNPEKYIEQKDWFQDFGPVWLTVTKQEDGIPSREVIYEEGLETEFKILPSDDLQDMQDRLPWFFQRGYKVLVDKDKQARKLPKPIGQFTPQEAPTPDLFHTTIKQFWFDAFQAAKYIWRGELWRVKHFDWSLKQHLLQMMVWHAVVCREITDFTLYQGKHLQDWTDPETYIRLMSVFGRFYPADSWRALDETIKRFSELSEEIATKLEIDDLHHLRERFTSLINDLKSNPPE